MHLIGNTMWGADLIGPFFVSILSGHEPQEKGQTRESQNGVFFITDPRSENYVRQSTQNVKKFRKRDC